MNHDRNVRNAAATTTMTSFEPLENRQMFSGGGLDPSFSLDGKATVDFGNGRTVIAKDLAVQPDGKTVVVGFSVGPKYSFAIARFNVDGSLDRSFGPRVPDGRFLTSVGDSHSLAESVAIQPDGKIVVAGQAFSDGDLTFGIVRYLPNGALDNTFDGDGKVIVKFDNASPNAIALQRDGKIVVAGDDSNGFFTSDSDFAVARLNPNGSLDRTFDGDGKKTIGFGWHEEALAVAIDYSGTSTTNRNYGKIILAGDQMEGDGLIVTRLNLNGSVDRDFNRAHALGAEGALQWSFNGKKSNVKGMTVQRDGKIVLAGTAGDEKVYGSRQFAVARLDSDGWFDRSFGGTGIVETGFGGDDVAEDVVQTSGGGLVVGGAVNGKFALAAYTADGKLNPSFGDGGRAQLYHGSVSADGVWVGMAIAPSGKLVIGGGYGFATARYTANARKPGDTSLIGGGGGGNLLRGATRAISHHEASATNVEDRFCESAILA